MSKVLVIYYSEYGSTKKYAEWIAEELNGELFNYKDVNHDQLSGYDTIILGGGLYAGNIKGLNLLISGFEKFDNTKDKKLVIFTCGLADYSKEINSSNIYKRLEKVLSKNILDNIKVFYLRGYIDYKKLRPMHRFLMYMMKKMIIKKGAENYDDEDISFLETYGKSVDFMDRNSIRGIIDYCKNSGQEDTGR